MLYIKPDSDLRDSGPSSSVSIDSSRFTPNILTAADLDLDLDPDPLPLNSPGLSPHWEHSGGFYANSNEPSQSDLLTFSGTNCPALPKLNTLAILAIHPAAALMKANETSNRD